MSKVRILVADDYKPWRAQARELLQQRPDCHITEACDGREAVQKATELSPDIVLLDIGMPVLNAAALAAGAEAYVLKANAATELLPVIAAALPDRSPICITD